MIFCAFFASLQVSQLSVVGIFKILTAYVFNTTLPLLANFQNTITIPVSVSLSVGQDEQMIAGSKISHKDRRIRAYAGTKAKFKVPILWDSFFNFWDLLSSGLFPAFILDT